MQRIAIYCGARSGNDPKYARAATELARYLAQQGIGIVYGGSNSGLMGIIADTALAAGAEVIGVIPDSLHQRELPTAGLPPCIMLPACMNAKR